MTEIAAYVMAGVLAVACVVVGWATVQSTRLENTRFRRGMRSDSDKSDKLRQNIVDKGQQIRELHEAQLAELAQQQAKASETQTTLTRDISKYEDSLNKRRAAWDTRISGLEAAGNLHAHFIIDTKNLKADQIELLMDNGYTFPTKEERARLSEYTQRPQNPIERIQERVATDEEKYRKAANRTKKRLAQRVNDADPLPASRDSIVELTPLHRRIGTAARNAGRNFRETVANAVRRGDGEGSQKELGTAESQHKPPSEKRNTRKGNP